jgi:hypothetical protein
MSALIMTVNDPPRENEAIVSFMANKLRAIVL